MNATDAIRSLERAGYIVQTNASGLIVYTGDTTDRATWLEADRIAYNRFGKVSNQSILRLCLNSRDT